MASSLSYLANNSAEGIHKIKCKKEIILKIGKYPELTTKILSAVLNTQKLKIIQCHTNVFFETGITTKILMKTCFSCFSEKSDLLMNTNLAMVYLFKIRNLVNI